MLVYIYSYTMFYISKWLATIFIIYLDIRILKGSEQMTEQERLSMIAEILYLREENILLKLMMMRGVEDENTTDVQRHEASKML